MSASQSFGRYLGLAAAAAALALGAHAAPQELTLRADTNLVLLDVAVLGPGGAPVAGIAKDRFLVWEDGKPQDLKFFSFADAPVSMGFVLDMSGSMTPNMGALARAVRALLKASNPEDEFFVAGFNDNARLGLPDGVPFSKNVTEVLDAMQSFRTAGRTSLYDGLVLSFQHVEKSHFERRVLVLISDGKDTASAAGFADVLRYARTTPVTVYTVALTEAADPDYKLGVLKQIANVTGGRFFRPQSPEDLERACLKIARDVRARYALAYTPPAESNGPVRKIRVEIKRGANEPKRTVRTRTEYSLEKPIAGSLGTNGE